MREQGKQREVIVPGPCTPYFTTKRTHALGTIGRVPTDFAVSSQAMCAIYIVRHAHHISK